MKFSKSQFLSASLTLGLAACGGSGSEKNQCRDQQDCSDGNACNLEHSEDGKIGQIGICMKVSGEGFFLCSRENPCPSGQFCFNGLCAPGCMTDLDCATNQYCDTQMDLPNGQLGTHLCVNKEVTGCSSAADCAETQTCVMGLCSAAAVVQKCTPRPDGQDGCDTYSVCLDLGEGEQEEYTCVTFPPCPQDGACPVGQIGSVCNEDDIPNKARICLTGLCKALDDCPANFKCILPGGSNLGMCSNGGFGSPCLTKDDCGNNLSCVGSLGGMPGFCMPGGGAGCEGSGGTCIDAMASCPQGTDIDVTKHCSDLTKLCCK